MFVNLNIKIIRKNKARIVETNLSKPSACEDYSKATVTRY